MNPTAYEVTGRGAALAQSELLDRYRFKYDKREQKDPRQIVIGTTFRFIGPLPIKIVLQFDESKQLIKLLISNFAGPGTSQYNLKPEQLDEAFLDHLGKYVLRKESVLIKEEISDDVRAMLRKKLQQAEEARKAEEALRKQNSTTEQLKQAVSHTVTKNTEKLKQVMNEQLGEKTEKLKHMFGKIKSQITPKKS